MSDTYPAAFEIEIDREPLTRYLKSQHRQTWCWLMGSVGLCVGSLTAAKYFERHADLPWTAMLWPIGYRLMWIGLSCVIVGFIGYLLSVRTVSTYVNSLLLAVEGPFLRLRKTVAGIEQDRKFHFNLLQVYATQQNARMKRLGISSLVITTSVGLQTTRSIEVPAVKDCLKVRDLLAEIDRQRENT